MSSHTRWPLNLFLTILIASSCLAQISPSPGKKPAQTNAAQEGAIVEERKTSVRFDGDGTLHETFRERVKVLKKDFASAAPELERAISTGPTSANEEKQLSNMLSDAYLRLKHTDKAD